MPAPLAPIAPSTGPAPSAHAHLRHGMGLALCVLALVASAGGGAACSDSSSKVPNSASPGDDDDDVSDDDDDVSDDDDDRKDGSTPRDGAAPDGMVDEDGGAKAGESEPNNGVQAADVNPMALPGSMTGAIDPANDLDLFSLSITKGEFWEWSLTPSAADLAPHLTIFDTTKGNLNPTVLASGTAGRKTTLQHFVLGNGSFVAVVRDARNVPTGTGKGGPTFGYALTARKITPMPTAVTLPSTRTGKLASLGSVDLYSFTLSATTGFDIAVKAARKASPSTLDSRISLFDDSQKKNVITNDDASGATTDSEVGGTLPPGTYVLVVENEGTNGADLSYEVSFSKR